MTEILDTPVLSHAEISQPLSERLEGATPVMAQYLEAKASQPDALLFFRMGDFYELFFDDAVTVAGALSLTLTKRGKHQGEEIPMAGVPAHAAEAYMAKLIRQGFRVAVCDQLEDPAEAKKRGSKSVVKRGVTRVLTPGTLTEDTLLDERGANRLVAISSAIGPRGLEIGLAMLELSTGEVETLSLEKLQVPAQLSGLRPSETLIADRLLKDQDFYQAIKPLSGVIQPQAASLSDTKAGLARLKRLYGVDTLDGFGTFSDAEISGLGLIAAYIEVTQAGRTPVLKPPRKLQASTFLIIDPSTRASLEIDRNTRGGRDGTLIASIDRTITSGGGRLLGSRLARPLIGVDEINHRLDAVTWWLERRDLRQSARQLLRGAGDMARCLSRLGLGRGGPRDIKALKDGLALGEALAALINAHKSDEPLDPNLPREIDDQLLAFRTDDATHALFERLELALVDEPPLSTREGGFIRAEYNANLNELVNLRNDSRKVILALEARLQAETGLALKIRFNAVLGYFIELTAKQAEGLTGTEHAHHFIHRQTLANQMRFSTPELIDLDGRIQRAGSEALALELRIFEDLREDIRAQSLSLQGVYDALSALDVAMAAAEWAEDHQAARPVLDESCVFDAKGVRHPVVYEALRSEGKAFTPNDARLDADGQAGARLAIVTGPNMAGKSTFLRQNALLILMAQAGLYVPAKSFRLGVADRLFSRVGAGDDLAQGRSTFMMEMVETAAILSQATKRSFVILDEIGRGTATFDGLAIAWASAENLHEVIGARCLFATHYHEMSKLETLLDHVENLSLTAREFNGDLIFLHEVKTAAADRSFGVQVAKLAGMPSRVVARARVILERLEADNAHKMKLDDLPLFAHMEAEPEIAAFTGQSVPSEVERALKDINPDDLSPREALQVIYNLREMLIVR
jgi:DNA mismatch repair protein MutS